MFTKLAKLKELRPIPRNKYPFEEAKNLYVSAKSSTTDFCTQILHKLRSIEPTRSTINLRSGFDNYSKYKCVLSWRFFFGNKVIFNSDIRFHITPEGIYWGVNYVRKDQVDITYLKNQAGLNELVIFDKLSKNDVFDSNISGGKCFIGKFFPKNDVINLPEQTILENIEKIHDFYSLSSFHPNYHINPPTPEEPREPEIIEDNRNSKMLYYRKEEVDSLVSSIKSKPFILLAGISGSGKTQLARIIAERFDELCDKDLSKPVFNIITREINGESIQFYSIHKVEESDSDIIAFVPVRPDWTDNKKVWGYLDLLNLTEGEKYRFYATSILKLCLKAKEYQNEKYFIILDEMNLARVEHYMSDILSLMESPNEVVNLHYYDNNEVSAKDDPELDIPSQINWPENVTIIGTVNIDETTYSFSPKVLDRAFVLEFADVDYELVLDEMPESFFKEFVYKVSGILKPINLHFGYRTVIEMWDYWNNDKREDINAKIDFLLMSKILPKIHGTSMELEDPLTELIAFCNDRYPKAKNKLEKMLRRAEATGVTSYF